MATVQRTGTGVSAEFAEKNNNAPVADIDIANKAYVDAVASGLSPKSAVLVATAAAIAAYTYANGAAGVGAMITFTVAGAQTVDGVVPALGDRILVKDETAANAPYNGIYVVTVKGTGILQEVWTRATDNDKNTEFPGAYTFSESGTVNTGAGFVCTNTNPVIVGTTPIVWTQFSGAGQITAGAGLTKTGNTLNVGAGDGIQADADSVTVKLDGATLTKSASGLKTTDGTFIKADGTVAFTGDQSMGSHQITNLADPTTAQGASTKNYVDAKSSAMFGSGIDLDLTLGSNTTLASTVWCKQYHDLDLGGFSLNQFSTDKVIVLFVSGTLTLGGGTIKSIFVQVGPTAGGAGGGAGAAGGAGGSGTSGVFVYARTISGTGTITASGANAVNGVNADAGAHAGNGATAGSGSTAGSTVFAVTIATGTAATGGGGGFQVGTAGAAGNGGLGPAAAGANDFTGSIKDIIALIFGASGSANLGATSQRFFCSTSGVGGGGSGGNTVAGGGGGGGGGGASGWWPGQTGGNGSAGAAGAGGAANNNGGGGGGGGGSGSLVLVYTLSAGAGLTVSANGGNGANGGTPNLGGGTGGRGGGGCGGIAIYSGPAGPTVTATAGAPGTSGNGAGTSGTAGYVYQMN